MIVSIPIKMGWFLEISNTEMPILVNHKKKLSADFSRLQRMPTALVVLKIRLAFAQHQNLIALEVCRDGERIKMMNTLHAVRNEIGSMRYVLDRKKLCETLIGRIHAACLDVRANWENTPECSRSSIQLVEKWCSDPNTVSAAELWAATKTSYDVPKLVTYAATCVVVGVEHWATRAIDHIPEYERFMRASNSLFGERPWTKIVTRS